MRIYNSSENTPANLGGKANNLYLLQRAGFAVPPFIVLPQSGLQAVSFTENQGQKLKITELQAEISTALTHFPETVVHFAVRSSAQAEDGAKHSFAGLFESYLYVGRSEIAEAVQKVWQSAFTERVQTYCTVNKLPLVNGLSVIIQAMVPAEVSGVAFGINPHTGNRKEKVIAAVFGLGDS